MSMQPKTAPPCATAPMAGPRYESAGVLFDETEVRRKRLDLVLRQFAGNTRHRRASGGVKSFAPLLEPSLQVGIGQPSQAGNPSDAFGTRAMTDDAGRNVGVRHPFMINGLSFRREPSIA